MGTEEGLTEMDRRRRGKDIKRRLLELNETQASLAKEASMNAKTLTAAIQGADTVRASTYDRLEAVLARWEQEAGTGGGDGEPVRRLRYVMPDGTEFSLESSEPISLEEQAAFFKAVRDDLS